MSPIEHVWDLVGRRLALDPRLAASKGELLMRICKYLSAEHMTTSTGDAGSTTTIHTCKKERSYQWCQ
ncbi:hypothetical protein TNCV_3802491 [Trichonephila clavipes]|nr:hypothetical protein TNCV_3802491 [Trichonephila clavipes]